MGRLFAWIRGLVADLRRRRVLRAGAVYVVAAWIAVQVGAITFSALYFPDWALTVLVVVAVVGFPVTLAAAWAFDLTPEGIRRTEAAGGPDSPPAASPAVRATLFGLVLLVSAGGGWLAWTVWLQPAATGSSPDEAAATGALPALDPSRLAVLYFDNPAGGPEMDAVARGLTEDLTHALSQVGALDVVSRNAVKPYRDGSVPLDSVARDLRVGTLVEGSVERTGDELVVTAQLVDASSGTHMASERVRRAGKDLFRVREAIVEQVVWSLRRRLGQRIERETTRRATDSEEAWKALHAGLEAVENGQEAKLAGATETARRLLRRADSLFARAEEEDPDWIDPPVRRAWASLRRAQLGGVSIRQWDPDALREGLAHAGRALEKRPGEPAALEIRGILRYRLSQLSTAPGAPELRSAAERDLTDAVASEPSRARAWAVLADLHRTRARFEEAREAARRSREADPYLYNDSRWLFLSAHLALELEELETARDLVRRGRNLYPGEGAFAALELLVGAGHEGPRIDPDSAWALLREVAGEDAGRRWPPGLVLVASTLARSGLEDSARAVASRARSAGRSPPTLHYYGANLHLLLGEPERAVAGLSRYLEERPDERPYVAHDWWWKSLRPDSAFRALVETGPVAAGPTGGDG